MNIELGRVYQLTEDHTYVPFIDDGSSFWVATVGHVSGERTTTFDLETLKEMIQSGASMNDLVDYVGSRNKQPVSYKTMHSCIERHKQPIENEAEEI